MIKFTDDEATLMLEILDDFLGFTGDISDGETSDWFTITDEVNQFGIEEYDSDILEKLVGYQFKVEQDGDHRHDGQMVDYEFTFKSPEGIESETWTDMCLVVGWNVCDDWTIK